ncbi:MAG: hypothetical protein Q4F84_10515, partial [Fibrobacter sp.]|nr:hypothetical protein [Fibrobacter sp.]
VRKDSFKNTTEIRLIALKQAHPSILLAGSVFSGAGVISTFNSTTGSQLCQGIFEFIMVRDFTTIGGSSTSAGSTYNPKTSGFKINNNDNQCTQKWLSCTNACSIGVYGPESSDRSKLCTAKCNDERNLCKKK